MSNDLGSATIQIMAICCLLIIHGVFVALNTAIDSVGKNDEKIQSTNKLICLVSAALGGYLAAIGLKEFIVYLVALVSVAQYFPRKVALQHDEGIVKALMPLAEFLSTLLRPLTFILMLFANILLKIFKQETIVTDEAFSEEDVMSMLEVGQESGVIKEEGKKMINSIFEFDDKLAYEIMTPRTDVFLIDIDDPLDEYIDDLMMLRYSRIPVYREDTDNIIGILNVKDYLRKAREDGFETVEIEPILREPYFVPETKNIDSLFIELQKMKIQIAILIDEYGGFSGIVTMEDIIEEVMGNITDEYDEEDEFIDKIDENIYLVDGDVNLDNLNDELSINLESDNSETIGGFILDILGEIPEESDIGRTVEFENFVFKIMSVKDRRIERVKIYILDKKEEDIDNSSKED